MSLKVYSFLRYLTVGGNWHQSYYDTNKLVKCLKGASFNGYVDVVSKGKRTRIEESNSEDAIEHLGALIGTQLTLKPNVTYYLCSVPDSSCTVKANRVSKVDRLARAIQRNAPILKIWDGLRFKRKMPKSSETNERDPAVLYQSLELLADPPTDGTFILVDDVCTSGAHFKAAAALLRARGVKAIVGKRQTNAFFAAQAAGVSSAIRRSGAFASPGRISAR
jgi:hypothetical protein